MKYNKIILLVLLGMVFVPIVPKLKAAAGTVTWTPTDPEPGDLLEITYDASGGPLAGKSDIKMWWFMKVEGTKNTQQGVPPSPSMWPEGTTAPSANTQWLYIISPMYQKGTDLWGINFTWSYMPDSIVFYFKSGTTSDNNDGNKWEIESALKDERIVVLNEGSFATPLFALQGETKHIYVKADSEASNWDVQIVNKVDSPVSLSPSATYDSTGGFWDLEVTIPSNLDTMLYDLKYSATINGHERTKDEPHALKVISEYKTDYTFMVIADPQHFRDGSYSGNKNAEPGSSDRAGNLTVILQEIDIINPEFVLLLGDVTEWTDEEAMENAKAWYVQYLHVPLFVLPGNHDEFELTGSDGNGEYGSGLGVFMRIFGRPYWKFSYGTHYFVAAFSDDQSVNSHPMADEIKGFIEDSLENPPAGTTVKFYMMHHPLDSAYYGTSENVDIADWLLSLMKSNGVDYYLHGHMHQDAYSVKDGTVHIGTDNLVGDPDYTGMRIIEMSGDEMVRFSYGPVDEANHYASSNPVHKVNVTFSVANDGTQTSASATINNGYNHSLQNAKVTFKMADPGSTKMYSTDTGEILEAYTENGVHYVSVGVPVEAESSTTVQISQVDKPIEENTSTTETNTTSAAETSSTPAKSPGFEITGLFLAIGTITILRAKKPKK